MLRRAVQRVVHRLLLRVAGVDRRVMIVMLGCPGRSMPVPEAAAVRS